MAPLTATTVRFIGPETAHYRAFYSHIAVTSYRIFPVADAAGTITYEDYSYGFDETDPTAVKKLSDDWTPVPGGQPWQRQAKSPCRYCNPTENAEDWFVKPGYVYKGGGAPVDACEPGNKLSPFEDGKPDFFPASIPAPMAYYYMGEGDGYKLTDSVSGNTEAGSVLHVEEHQLTPGTEDGSGPQPGAVHSGPNWQADEYFGSSIACGKIDDTIIQKDTLSLADVDYGSTGSWAWSVWFRHEAGVNFPDYSREQFFGHGNPVFPTTSFDQMHIQVSSK